VLPGRRRGGAGAAGAAGGGGAAARGAAHDWRGGRGSNRGEEPAGLRPAGWHRRLPCGGGGAGALTCRWGGADCREHGAAPKAGAMRKQEPPLARRRRLPAARREAAPEEGRRRGFFVAVSTFVLVASFGMLVMPFMSP